MFGWFKKRKPEIPKHRPRVNTCIAGAGVTNTGYDPMTDLTNPLNPASPLNPVYQQQGLLNENRSHGDGGTVFHHVHPQTDHHNHSWSGYDSGSSQSYDSSTSSSDSSGSSGGSD